MMGIMQLCDIKARYKMSQVGMWTTQKRKRAAILELLP
jgi:hypothetical protein